MVNPIKFNNLATLLNYTTVVWAADFMMCSPKPYVDGVLVYGRALHGFIMGSLFARAPSSFFMIMLKFLFIYIILVFCVVFIIVDFIVSVLCGQ